MRIIAYECQDMSVQGWHFNRIELGNVNLLVGDSGAGKTRFLNTIFNLGASAIAKEFSYSGQWDITFQHEDVKYRWFIKTVNNESNQPVVVNEELTKILGDNSSQPIIQRDERDLIFRGEPQKKLSRRVSSVSLFQDEDEIHPIYEAFSLIQRRKFFEDALLRSFQYEVLPAKLPEQIERERNLKKLFPIDTGINLRLFLLKEYFPDIFANIKEYYKAVFPLVVDLQVIEFNKLHPERPMAGLAPVVCIQEEGVSGWIECTQLSSGMQKVLLVLTDMSILPEGGVYLIDEYENSLGVTAMDFLPNFLDTHINKGQFIITSHHPYIINKIPLDDWLIFHRSGSEVKIRRGAEFKARFSKSRQEYFLQLLNDPFYREGVE